MQFRLQNINFAKTNLQQEKYIDEFNYKDLVDLEKILFMEDEILHMWYFDKKNNGSVPNNKVSEKLKRFKL